MVKGLGYSFFLGFLGDFFLYQNGVFHNFLHGVSARTQN